MPSEEFERQIRHRAYHRDHTDDSTALPPQSSTRPFFNPHPYHKVVLVGMGAVVGYCTFLSIQVTRARIPLESGVLIPLHFNWKGNPDVFVAPWWGTWVYPITAAYTLANYLVRDRGALLPVEASIIYGSAAGLIALCHHKAALVVRDSKPAGEIKALLKEGIEIDYSLDRTAYLFALVGIGLTMFSVFSRERATNRARREAGIDVLPP